MRRYSIPTVIVLVKVYPRALTLARQRNEKGRSTVGAALL